MLKICNKFLLSLLTVLFLFGTIESTSVFAATNQLATEDDECKKIVDGECEDIEYVSDEEVASEFEEFYDEDSVPDVEIDQITRANFSTDEEYKQWLRDNPTAFKTARFLIPAAKAIVTLISKERRVVQQTLKATKKNISVRNGKLAKKAHPVTKVSFNKKGFPIFPSKSTVQLSLKQIKSSNAQQFKRCNEVLLIQIQTNSTVRARFTAAQIKQIKKLQTPSGMTWHHHENRGVMQLVDTYLHSKTGHTGGKSIWGKL